MQKVQGLPFGEVDGVAVFGLENKLKVKYGAGTTAFSAEFLERVRELDRLRNGHRTLQPFPEAAVIAPVLTEHKRLYYLLDASVLVHLYVPDEQIIPSIDHLIEQRGLQKAFLFVPNFCVAETFNSIARKHYRERLLNQEQYQLCKAAFAHDIHNGQLFYHHELDRYHILNSDYVIPFEHLFPSERADGTERHLSTYDVLIIAMGMELMRITGGSTYVVTCDKRIAEVVDILRKLRKEERHRFSVPDYIRFPKSIYLWSKKLSELPVVEGQKLG